MTGFGIASIVLAMGCAKGGQQTQTDPDASGPTPDASCGDMCDQDGDGVFDGVDKCPNTPHGAVVNHNGCSDSQLTPMLEPTFPPYGLTWTSSGTLGRAGGLLWTYDSIQRKDLFHIDWIMCDDPAMPCGLSLDGPIDVAAEDWLFSAVDSTPAMGKLVFTNTTKILLADTTTPTLNGRLTVTIVDASDMPIVFADVATLGVVARSGSYGAEIKGTAFKVTVLAEVKDATGPYTPYMDYYDAAPTPVAGGNAQTSFDGWFYDK